MPLQARRERWKTMMWAAFSILLLVLSFYTFLSLYILFDIIGGYISQRWARQSQSHRA